MAALKQGLETLVIEDNPGDFILIQEYLLKEVEHPQIQHASTLAEANELLKEQHDFDIILLDLTLPDASGESLVRHIVKLSKQTPVIVLTGYENKQFGLKTLSMGVADYLLKDELNPFLLSKSISYSIERNRINRSLRQSEKQYRNLFDLSPLPMWVFDADTLEFLDVNQRAIEHYGYSRKEFLSMTIKDIRPKEEIPHLEQVLEDSLSTEGVYRNDIFTHQKKDGTKIQVDIRSTLFNYNGQKAKMVVVDDVTDRLETEKKLALNEKRFKSLVQDGSDLIAILSRDGIYKYLSPTYESVLGMSPERYEGVNAYDLVHKDDRNRIREIVNNLEDNQRKEIEPYRIKDADGEWRWMETTVTSMFENPAVEGFVANSRDVTESIQREQKLQESLELYEYVTKATDDVVYDWDLIEDILYWDDSFHEKFVYDIEKGTYSIDYWAQNVHPEDLDQTQESLNTVLDDPSQSKWEQEYRFQKKDGSYATVFERGFIIRDEDGKAIRMIGSLQDITERKRYEEKLEELALVASKTTDVIIMTDPNEQITWVNDAFEELTGYHFEEVVGKVPGDILQGPETDPNTKKRLANAIANRKSIQEVILNYSKTGKKYWLDLTIDPIFDEAGNCEGFIAIEKDVTDQIERQRELRNSVERYEIVSKATSDTIWDLDLESDTIEYNQNIYGMFGYDKNEVKNTGDWWRDKIHPDDRQKVLDKLDQATKNHDERLQLEYRFKATDGSYKYIYDRIFIVTDDTGKAVRIIGAMQDVSERKRTEKSLREINQKNRLILESTEEGIYGIDTAGRCTFINKAAANMLGYKSEECIGENMHELIHHEHVNGEPYPESECPIFISKNNHESCRVMDEVFWRKDGTCFNVEYTSNPMIEEGEIKGAVVAFSDITARKQHEKELQESLKEKETLLLEIHHRVKNNLAVVSGMMQLQAFNEENKQLRNKLLDSVARIQTMGSIHELLYKSENFSKLNFDENLKKLVNDISDTFQTDLELEVHFDVDSINLNINQAIPCSLIVNEVFTNILKHAFEDEDSGKIVVSVGEKDNHIFISIDDNGKGLPPKFDEIMSNKTLGLKLIDTLAEQLDADYDYKTLENGVRFNLSFEKAEVKGIGNAHLI